MVLFLIVSLSFSCGNGWSSFSQDMVGRGQSLTLHLNRTILPSLTFLRGFMLELTWQWGGYLSAKVNTVFTKLLISLAFGTYTPNVSNGYKIYRFSFSWYFYQTVGLISGDFLMNSVYQRSVSVSTTQHLRLAPKKLMCADEWITKITFFFNLHQIMLHSWTHSLIAPEILFIYFQRLKRALF